jgi:hypothetical protein
LYGQPPVVDLFELHAPFTCCAVIVKSANVFR